MIPRTLFTEAHDSFRETVRRFVERELAPHHAAWEEAGVVPREAWRKAGAVGLLCCNIPEQYGGMGGDFLYSAIVLEELAAAGLTGPAFSLHSDIVAPYILHYGTEEQKRHWLPRMATGEALGAVAMTEPSAGSDLQAIKTTALRDGGDYVINGQKVFITNAQGADLVVLAAKTDPRARGKGISLILVETDRAGFQRGKPLHKIGCKALDTSELFFSDLRVPLSNLLGEEGRGFAQLMTELAQERLVQAVRAVASAEAALRWTVDYTVNRQAFGQSLADLQNTQFKLAEMRADTVMQRVFIDRCLELHLQGKLGPVDAAIAKMQATELQGKVADQCLQLHGGWGYMWEYPIARAFADARMSRIAGGSIEVMKQIIARHAAQAGAGGCPGAGCGDGISGAESVSASLTGAGAGVIAGGVVDRAEQGEAAMNPAGCLIDKVVVVTGAGRGIGREIALLAASEGARVVVNDLGVDTQGDGADEGPAFDVVEEIRRAGGTAIANTASVAEPGPAEGIVRAAVEAFGQIDCVVNNAGILRDHIFHKMSVNDFEIVIKVHLMGTFYVSRAAAQYFREQGSGSFVHFTSTSGLVGNFGQANYAAAKLGIVGLSKSIALDMQRFGVRSNCVSPFAWSRLTGTIPAETEAEKARVERIKAMGPEKVAPLAVFLASDLSKGVSGQIFASRMNEIFLMGQSRPIRGMQRSEGWTPQTLASHMVPAMQGMFYPLERSGDVFSWDPA